MTIKPKEKKFYSSYSKLAEVKLISIGIASPDRIKQWAEKTLPNGKILGEVVNANTLHHKTFKPQKGGLFCERIFGPLKDFECACGKPFKSKKQISRGSNETKTNLISPKSILGEIVTKTRNFCNICEVEYTWSVMRRYQLGYVKLVSPVTHVWYLKGNPSYLSILLDIKKRHLEYITYCSETFTIENVLKGVSVTSKSSDIVSSWNKLKEQMVLEKTKKELVTESNEKKQDYLDTFSTVVNQSFPRVLKKVEYLESNKEKTIKKKIEKRDKITLKKKFYWKFFYNFQINTEFVNDWYFFLTDTQINLKTLSFLNFNKNYKSYTKRVDLKNLKILSLFITKLKYENFNNLTDRVSAKLILKNLFLPFYIILILNIGSQKSISNFTVNNIWNKIVKKSLKRALNRINGIFNKMDALSFNQNWLNGLSTLENLKEIMSKNDFDPQSALGISQEKNKVNPRELKSLFYHAPFYFEKNKKLPFFDFNPYWNEPFLLKKETNFPSLTKKGIVKNNEKNQESFSILKKIFFKSLKLNESKIGKELFFDELAFHEKNRLGSSMLFSKSHLYPELFTLSNISFNPFGFKAGIVFSNLIISEFFLTKNKTTIYSIILKNLTDLFFKILLKTPSIKNSFAYRYRKKTLLHSLELGAFLKDFKITKNKDFSFYLFQNKYHKTNFKDYKNSLDVFYLFGQYKNDDLIFSNFYENELLTQLGLKSSIIKNVKLNTKHQSNVKLTSKELLNDQFKIPNDQTAIKKMYNNFYSVSHRERWEGENDWSFFYFFMTAPCERGERLIPNYKHQFENGFNRNYSSIGSNTFLNYENSSEALQRSAFFSGPGIVQQLLNEFNFFEMKKMDKQNRILLYQLNKHIFKVKKKIFNPNFIGNKKKLSDFFYKKSANSAKKELKECYKKRDLLIRRTKLVRKLFIKESTPQITILTVLPVLPPDLRPIVKMGGQIAASDLNRLYQRVIYRNDRLKKFLKDPATSHSYEMKYAQRLLQEAVDNLIQNGKSGVVSEKDARGRALKSLSDILKGKQGRFRQYLLGKRVDYSGRSVIVVGPKLKLHECGIPKEMAIELYLPFLLKRILTDNLARTVVGAKTLIKTNPPLVWELLREIMRTCPVLLNRAPTLHRLGIQAFQPKLIDGRAILLHPLVCSAFNADFDGDQMAVHIPITVEARAEAWKLMLSRNNILSTATGDPLAMPSQDMVLGCYYLTTSLLNLKTQKNAYINTSGFYYSNINQILQDFNLQQIDLHSNIWLKCSENINIENGSDQEEPIEIRLDSYGSWKEIYNKSQRNYNSKNNSIVYYILTTPGRIIFNQIIQKTIKNSI